MWFIDQTTRWFNNASDYLYSAYVTVSGWIWPFSLLSSPLYYLHDASGHLAYYSSQLSAWADAAAKQLLSTLNWDTIRSYILSWLPGIETVASWFSIRWQWLLQGINTWWLSITPTIQAWIGIATQGIDALKVAWDNFWRIVLPALQVELNLLRTAWSNFWTETLPDLVSFQWLRDWWHGTLKDVQELIFSQFKEWFPFYDDFVALWGDIKLFFVDPFEWLLSNFADWFLGKE